MRDCLTRDEPVLMGIVNVTPDSFSDGGLYFDAARAIEHGLKLKDEGAAILDIGGESTRPGATPVSAEEEIARVVPVLRGLKHCGAILSIDTRHAAVMRAAIAEGAGMVNDVSALTHDAESLAVARDSRVFVCLMHMKGNPRTMQEDPHYDDVFEEVFSFLKGRVEACRAVGIPVEKLCIDPGIGFGKTLEHNRTILSRLADFKALGVPVILGASRKRFIQAIDPGASVDKRLPGSLAACLAAYQKGVRLFRVHDVAETVQALKVFRAISEKIS